MNRSTLTRPEVQADLKSIEYLLKSLDANGNMLAEESESIQNMISKKQQKLALKVYQESHPRSKNFLKTKSGYFRSFNPELYARSEEELLTKLYNYYFGSSFEREYQKWLQKRFERGIKSEKTLREDNYIWETYIKPEPLFQEAFDKISPAKIEDLFEKWTGKGLITKKAFANRKSILNGIFKQAVLDELIPVNFIPSIETRNLIFKEPKDIQPYSIEERSLLLEYIKGLPQQDAYSLAIQLAFHGLFRVGELKALKHDCSDGEFIHIDAQLVEANELSIDSQGKLKVGRPMWIQQNPKGNHKYSIRTNDLTPECARIIDEAIALNPKGKYLFEHKGLPLTTDSFNRRLQKYCKDIGIPYRSSHKIRFCSASMLLQLGNMPINDLRRDMGHSNIAMTEHYAIRNVRPKPTGYAANVLG